MRSHTARCASMWLPLVAIVACLVAAPGAESPPPDSTGGATTAPNAATDWRAQGQTIGTGRLRITADAVNGGRLVEFSLDGRNALYADPLHPEWVFPDNDHNVGPSAGRFDIGPEETLPEHPTLWTDPWTFDVVAAPRVRMTSRSDAVTGVRLTREFSVTPGSTRLHCSQTITNQSSKAVRRSYWGRTLVAGGGIFVAGLTPESSRFPKGYISYTCWPDFQIHIAPNDPAVTIFGDLLMIRGALQLPKIGLDSQAGWLAYLVPNGLLFVKRFPVHPDRRYADLAGLTVSVYKQQDRLVEIESLGPEEVLEPGQSATFSEDWWLFDHPFPAQGEAGDPAAIRAFVDSHAVVPDP